MSWLCDCVPSSTRGSSVHSTPSTSTSGASPGDAPPLEITVTMGSQKRSARSIACGIRRGHILVGEVRLMASIEFDIPLHLTTLLTIAGSPLTDDRMPLREATKFASGLRVERSPCNAFQVAMEEHATLSHDFAKLAFASQTRVRSLQEEIAALEAELAAASSGAATLEAALTSAAALQQGPSPVRRNSVRFAIDSSAPASSSTSTATPRGGPHGQQLPPRAVQPRPSTSSPLSLSNSTQGIEITHSASRTTLWRALGKYWPTVDAALKSAGCTIYQSDTERFIYRSPKSGRWLVGSEEQMVALTGVLASVESDKDEPIDLTWKARPSDGSLTKQMAADPSKWPIEPNFRTASIVPQPPPPRLLIWGVPSSSPHAHLVGMYTLSRTSDGESGEGGRAGGRGSRGGSEGQGQGQEPDASASSSSFLIHDRVHVWERERTQYELSTETGKVNYIFLLL